MIKLLANFQFYQEFCCLLVENNCLLHSEMEKS